MKIENEEELKSKIADAAFPIHITENLQIAGKGLSKRELYAALFMQAIIGRFAEYEQIAKSTGTNLVLPDTDIAVNIADKLINSLNKKPCQH